MPPQLQWPALVVPRHGGLEVLGVLGGVGWRSHQSASVLFNDDDGQQRRSELLNLSIHESDQSFVLLHRS